jgi:hypothetical protein
MIIKISICILISSAILLSSCEKKIIEITPVLEIEDISIDKAKDIIHFSFPSEKVGYAASDTNFIYKTIDGGKTWTTITNSDWPTYLRCKGIVFFDELKGFCLMGAEGYSTDDGGLNWTNSKPWYGMVNKEAFCGVTSSGVGIIGINESYNKTYLYRSLDKGQTFDVFSVITHEGELAGGRVSEANIFTYNTYDNYIEGISYSDFSTFKINLTGDVNEFYYDMNKGVGVGAEGYLTENSNGYSYKTLPIHDYDFYSVDNKNGVAFAVGNKTIVTNMDIQSEEKWNHVFDIHGNGFQHKFLRVRFKDEKNLYISGENGLIWKARI